MISSWIPSSKPRFLPRAVLTFEKLMYYHSRMTQYFHEIGCKVAPPTEGERAKLKIDASEKSAHRIAKLKLPLEFPKTRTPASNKRR